MPSSPARLFVREVSVIGDSEVRVSGELRSGTVREGMQACVSLGTISVVTMIKRVECLPDASGDGDISISLDAPGEEACDLWKELCSPGWTIGIIENAKQG